MTTINTNLITYFLKAGRKVRVYVTPDAHQSLDCNGHMPVVHVNGSYVWVVNHASDHVCRVNLDCIRHAFLVGEEQGNTLQPESSTRREAVRKCILWNPKSPKVPRDLR